MNVLLTGDPEIRAELVDALLERLDRRVGGMQSFRDEDDGETIIAMRDLEDDQTTVLARPDGDGTEFGDYRIDVPQLSEMARSAIVQAIRRGDMIVIDRIGQLQMHSSTFRESVRDAFRGSEDVLAVVDREYVDEFGDEGEIVTVTEDNYDQVLHQLLDRFTQEKI